MPELTSEQRESNKAAASLFRRMVVIERNTQDAKWGDQQSKYSRLFWLGILTEEVGELSKAIIENKSAQAERELIQVAAVCQAAFEFCFKDLAHA